MNTFSEAGGKVFFSSGSKGVDGMLRDIVAVRGGGEIGTAIAHKLTRSGFKVMIIENEMPLSIRRTVAYAQAVFSLTKKVEGIEGILVNDAEGIMKAWEQQKLPVIVDSECHILREIPVDILVDAIMARKNTGTHCGMAAATIATGPGFSAGQDVDIVIETKKGHDQGRLIFEGSAEPETTVPGESEGMEANKVINATSDGKIHNAVEIGDHVTEGQVLAYIDHVPVHSPWEGFVRGIIHDGTLVGKGQKIIEVNQDISPVQLNRLSQRSRDVAGGVLEAVMFLKNKYQLHNQ